MSDVQDIGVTSNTFKSITCKNCEERIYAVHNLDGQIVYWTHDETESKWCKSTTRAEPVEVK